MSAPAASTTVLKADGLGVSFRVQSGLLRKRQVWAVRHVDLGLRRGRVVGLVGESGCGKSTVARALLGLQRPSRGTVLLHGVDLWSMSQRDRKRRISRHVSMVFQDPSSSLNPRMDVADLLADPLHIHTVGTAHDRRARVAGLLDLVHLPSALLHRRAIELSGGQRQRVAIARALALEPAVLVADEPTSALDVSVRTQILDLFTELRDRLQLALLFVSHDIHTVRHLSDSIVVMYLGNVVEEGPASAIGADPRHPYTHALFSAAPSLTNPDRERVVLRGTVPSVRNPPSGCPFHERCWRATDECSRQFPFLTDVGGARGYRCFYPMEPMADGGSAAVAPSPGSQPPVDGATA